MSVKISTELTKELEYLEERNASNPSFIPRRQLRTKLKKEQEYGSQSRNERMSQVRKEARQRRNSRRGEFEGSEGETDETI